MELIEHLFALGLVQIVVSEDLLLRDKEKLIAILFVERELLRASFRKLEVSQLLDLILSVGLIFLVDDNLGDLILILDVSLADGESDLLLICRGGHIQDLHSLVL